MEVTLPETNSQRSWKWAETQKKINLNQLSIFRCELLVSGRVVGVDGWIDVK